MSRRHRLRFARALGLARMAVAVAGAAPPMIVGGGFFLAGAAWAALLDRPIEYRLLGLDRVDE